MAYAQPNNLDEALTLLGDPVMHPENSWNILAGGTDFYPASLESPMPARVLDIHSLGELKTIEVDALRVRIGAGVTWSDIINAQLPSAFDGLKLAAREIGSVQIQNRATIAGNLCNASPAADGVPPLLTLDAAVELSSSTGVRKLSLQEFILGNRLTARRSDELVTAIVVPATSTAGNAGFLKLGARKYLIISISMVAVRLQCDEQGTISDAAVSVGSCSLVAQRLVQLEKQLLSCNVKADPGLLVTEEHLRDLAPINDVRSTAHYRMDASLELLRRSVSTVANSLL